MSMKGISTKARSRKQSKGARRLALELLLRREEHRIPLEQLLSAIQEEACNAPEERAFLHELVYGVYRWRGRLDWIIDLLIQKRPEKLPQAIRYILQLGLYQLLFLQRIPPFAIVYEAVELAKQFGHRGTAKLVNGVLRKAQRQAPQFPYPSWETDPVGYLSIVYSHPRWMVERWIARWGFATTRTICMANNQYPPLSLRINRLRTTRSELLKLFQEEGIAALPSPAFAESIRLRDYGGKISALPGYAQGWFQVQDEGALLISTLCAPKPGMYLLDVCAAPGGKSTHLAEQMQDQGLIVALDRSFRRLRRLQENASRLALHSIHPVQGDGEYLLFGQPFDLVLLDAPCSGLGVLRRHPEGKWEKTPALIQEMSTRQHRLLEQAQRHVRRGGVLVYSVCSCESEETGEIIHAFLRHHSDFYLESLLSLVPASLTPLLTERDTMLMALPGLSDLDGFFAVRLRRR